jgi:restriction endonuclease S subunit
MLTNQEFKGVISLILKESIKEWGTTNFSYFGEWAQGCGFPKKYQGSTDGEILFCKVSDMNLEGNNIFIKKTANTITADLARKIRVKIHKPGTVIFPKIGGAIATNKRRILSKRSVIDNNCTGLIPNENTNFKWLYYMLRYFDFSLFQTGTSVPALNQGSLEKNVHLPKVPVFEQKLISNFLDYFEEDPEDFDNAPKLPEQLESIRSKIKERLTYVRNIEAFSKELEIQPKLISQLRQSILQEAVSGKLVPQDPNDELASELLNRFKIERDRLIKQNTIKKDKDLLKISEEVPYKLPSSWNWVRLGQIKENTPNAMKAGPFGSALKKDCYVKDGYKIYGQEQVIKQDSKYGDYYIDQKKYRQLESCAVKPGDILISLVGTVGKVLILPEGIAPGIINPRLVKISLQKEINREYIKIFLSSLVAKKMIEKHFHGSTMDIINLGILKIILFPLPPVNEQQRIVKKVEELMRLCDELEEKVSENQEHSNLLMETVLKEAFAT